MVDKKTVDQRSVLLRGLILVLLLMLECRELEIGGPHAQAFLCLLFGCRDSCALHAFKFFEEVESVPLPEAQNLDEWFAKGAAALSLRAQAVDLNETQATREQGAQASTLRTRLGYTSAQWHYLSFGIDVDDIRALGGDEHYYNGANGQQDDLFVAAPEGTDLHAAWLMADLANTQIRYGRQRLVLDDGRLIGSSSWDQKETTVSGVTLRNATLNVTRLRAGSLHKRHTGYASAHPNHDQAMKARFAHLEYLGFIHSALSVFYL